MSTNMSIFDNNTLPAHLKQYAAVMAPINLGGAADTRNRITMKGNRFTLKVGNTQEKTLEVLKLPVIIVGAHDYVSRSWYATKYNPAVKARPDCYSADGITPNPQSAKRQADQCAICPQNQKGSSETGGKACAFFKRLVVLIAGKSAPFIVDVKGMGIFGSGDTTNGKYGLTEYSKLLAGKGINPSLVITELTFDTAVSVPKLFFTPVGYINEEMSVQVQKILADKALLDEYKSVDLESLGEAPSQAITTGPAPSNIPASNGNLAQQVQAAAPKPANVVSEVRKFEIPKAEVIPQVMQQSAPASAATADIDALLDGINF